MNSQDIELQVLNYFNERKHLIIPNLSWGLLSYEADMFVVRPSGYCLEVEIKISKQDIKADLRKSKWRNNNDGFGRVHTSDYIVREFYMALPKELCNEPNIPDFAGILQVEPSPNQYWSGVTLLRKPLIWKRARKITVTERAKLGRLLGLRYWNLKRAFYKREETK